MESISRISGLLESARDLTLEAARDASSSRKAYSVPLPTSQLKKLLDSRNDREILEGLRRIISMSYCNPDSHQSAALFSSVLKNIASPSLPIKKLVYIYLLQHAESEPDTALLAINTIQKSLSSSDQQLRALALRVMSGIRVPVISQIVSLGIKRGIADMSPLVRKAAALAIPKCWKLDPSTSPQLLEYLSVLLGDRQYFVAGAAVVAFMEMCPERIDLIHPHYRSLVRKLVDMEEWGQLATLRLMTRYARLCFPRRIRREKKLEQKGNTETRLYDDIQSQSRDIKSADAEGTQVLDSDLVFLLNTAKILLYTRNSAIVVAVARCYLHLGDDAYLDIVAGPLISLLRGPMETKQIALYNIVQIALARPVSFVKYATHFFIRGADTPEVWNMKLEVLTIIFPYSSAHMQLLILNELSHFAHSQNPILIQETVRAIGRCAQSSSNPAMSSRCLKLLLSHIDEPNNYILVSESLTIIRQLIQAAPTSHALTITRLAKNLDTTTNAQARASIIWLVGEFSAGTDDGGKGNVAADVFRILLKSFADETEEVKGQIVLLGAKIYLHYINGLKQDEDGQITSKSEINQYPNLSYDSQAPTVLSPERDVNNTSDLTRNSDSEIPTSADRQFEGGPSLHPIAKLWHHVLTLARYDMSYDLRDRTRLYRSLLPDPTTTLLPTAASTQLATLLLLALKPVPQMPSPSQTRAGFTLGSASLIIGEQSGPAGLPGYEALPDWVELGQEPSPKLRDVDEGLGVSNTFGAKPVTTVLNRLDGSATWQNNRASSNKGKEVSLDAWLDNDDGPDSDEDEDEDEDDEDDEEYDDEEYENTDGSDEKNDDESSEEESSEAEREEEGDDDDEEEEQSEEQPDGDVWVTGERDDTAQRKEPDMYGGKAEDGDNTAEKTRLLG